MELAYVFGALSHTPRRLLLGKHLPRIDKMLRKLDESSPEVYGNGSEYWDGGCRMRPKKPANSALEDFCLGHFLRGVVQFTAVYQVCVTGWLSSLTLTSTSAGRGCRICKSSPAWRSP